MVITRGSDSRDLGSSPGGTFFISLYSSFSFGIWYIVIHSTYFRMLLSSFLLFFLFCNSLCAAYLRLLNSQNIARPRVNNLFMSLQMEVLNIRTQSDFNNYFQEISKSLPDATIIRWYIAKIDNGFATVEVVYNPNANALNQK